MVKRVKSLSVIGYVLAILYVTSAIVYAQVIIVKEVQLHAACLSLIYAVLFVFALQVVRIKNWARRGLVLLNAAQCFYLLALSKYFPEFVQPSYIFMHIMVVLFFINKKTKVYFYKDWRTARKSVLVVDDDPGLLKTVKGILLARGYSVLTASTGEKGMQVAKLQKPDLILLDVILPGLKGRDVCARIKEEEQSADIPVVFLTAKDSLDDIKAEMAVGGISHLTKPVDAKKLLAEVKRLIG